MAVLLPDLAYVDGAFRRDVAVEYDRETGLVTRTGTLQELGSGAHVVERLPARALMPGFVNAHSHAFQRAIRGHTQWRPADIAARSDFWTWREAMYAAVLGLTPDEIGIVSRYCFLEMLRAGITTVGEFHYVHCDEDGRPYANPNELAQRIVMAAEEVGIRLVLINCAYVTAGIQQPLAPEQRRFNTPDLDAFLDHTGMLRESVTHRPRVSVGVAAHSLRAVPREWLPRLRDWAAGHRTPFHMHVSEQTAEVESCRAEYGMRPIELLAADGLLSERFTAIHATHVDEGELLAIGESGATVCACPSTERDLGDGFLRGYDLMEAGAHIALGSDSQAILDFFEEMRVIEYNERLQRRRRNVITAATGDDRAEPAHALIAHATVSGARSLGLNAGRIGAGALADFVAVDLTHPVIAGWTDDTLAAMLTFCAPTDAVADVWVGGVRRVTDSRHALDGVGVITFRDVVRRLFGRRRVTV